MIPLHKSMCLLHVPNILMHVQRTCRPARHIFAGPAPRGWRAPCPSAAVLPPLRMAPSCIGAYLFVAHMMDIKNKLQIGVRMPTAGPMKSRFGPRETTFCDFYIFV